MYFSQDSLNTSIQNDSIKKKVAGTRINHNSLSFCLIFVASSTKTEQFLLLIILWLKLKVTGADLILLHPDYTVEGSETSDDSLLLQYPQQTEQGNWKIPLRLLQQLSNLEFNCRSSFSAPPTKCLGSLEGPELCDLYPYPFIWISHAEGETMPTIKSAKH